MRARALPTLAILVASTLWLVGASPPAGAALVVTTTGTQVLATATGAGGVDVRCASGGLRVGGVLPSPAIACTAVTRIRVEADGAAQVVDLRGATPATFPALESTSASLGGGADTAYTGAVRNNITGGPGADTIHATATGEGGDLDPGVDPADVIRVAGTAADETFSVTAQVIGEPFPYGLEVERGTWRISSFDAANLVVDGAGGNDTIDATGVDGGAWLVRTTLLGGAGDDLLLAGDLPATIEGGPGTNTLQGGPAGDDITTTSPADTIRGGGGHDAVRDLGPGRIGGRTFLPTVSAADTWAVDLAGDAAVRTRVGPGFEAVVVGTLARTGRQALSLSAADEIVYETEQPGAPPDRVVLDLMPQHGAVQRIAATTTGTLVDIVVPGTTPWSIAAGVVTFGGGSGLERIIVGGATLRVRRAYTDPDERFVHRAFRDLQHVFAGDGLRAALADQITAGTLTRAALVGQLVDSDTVRALAVDRAFVAILRRGTDSAGRAYWRDRLADGLVLRRLRANLYGSPEYVTEQGGGTNPGYVAAAYRDILGRTAGPAEIDYWVGEIQAGLTKGTVADRFLNTPEARTVVIRDQFLRFADREPTSTELGTWNTALSSSTIDGEVALVRMLAASTAYYTRPDETRPDL